MASAPTPIQCSCGRSWTHCRQCGSKNVYRKRFESDFVSKQQGTQVDVYLCRRCGCDFASIQECQAPVITKAIYKSQPPPEPRVDNRPQFRFQVGSEEYLTAFAVRYNDLADNNKRLKTPNDIKLFMQTEGWILPEENLLDTNAVQTSNTNDKTDAVSMEEIIDQMKKEQS